jgi:hypothetical protein
MVRAGRPDSTRVFYLCMGDDNGSDGDVWFVVLIYER